MTLHIKPLRPPYLVRPVLQVDTARRAPESRMMETRRYKEDRCDAVRDSDGMHLTTYWHLEGYS